MYEMEVEILFLINKTKIDPHRIFDTDEERSVLVSI
jgi:hypothetical protein